METLLNRETNPAQLSPLTLAFIGDSVYDTLVREKLVCDANRPIKKLHFLAVEKVRASAQAEAYEKIAPVLTEEENGVFLRGRNAHPHHVPKNGNIRDYHYATAMECLFGYLYLSGKIDRIRELFNLINSEE